MSLRLALLCCMLLLHASASAAEATAPFGLRFGMSPDEVPFRRLPKTIPVPDTFSLTGPTMRWEGTKLVTQRPKPREVANPLLYQCAYAFDKMTWFALYNEKWLDWALSDKRPIDDFVDMSILGEKEREPLGDPGDTSTSDGLTRDSLAETLRANKLRDRQEERKRDAIGNFTGKVPLLEVISQSPSDWFTTLPDDRYRNWQQRMIADNIDRHRAIAAYETDMGGKPRQMCLVFGEEGLISIYVPHSELADVWPQIIETLQSDNRFTTTLAEGAASALNQDLKRVQVHATWVDEKRDLAVVAYVTAIKKKGWFDGSLQPSYAADETAPFIIYTNLGLRAGAFTRFKEHLQPLLHAEADKRQRARDAALEAFRANKAREKAAQDDLIKSFQTP